VPWAGWPDRGRQQPPPPGTGPGGASHPTSSHTM